MTRTLTTLAILAFFWPFWQQYPVRYVQRPAAQTTVAAPSCPNGRCCLGGRCPLAAPQDLPKPPVTKMAGDAPKEVK